MTISSGWWAAGSIACLAIAAAYGVLALRQQPSFILRWGHTGVWLLLAFWALVHALGLPEVLGTTSAVLGGALYVAFFTQLLRSRRARTKS